MSRADHSTIQFLSDRLLQRCPDRMLIQARSAKDSFHRSVSHPAGDAHWLRLRRVRLYRLGSIGRQASADFGETAGGACASIARSVDAAADTPEDGAHRGSVLLGKTHLFPSDAQASKRRKKMQRTH